MSISLLAGSLLWLCERLPRALLLCIHTKNGESRRRADVTGDIFLMFFVHLEYTHVPHRTNPAVSIGHWPYLLLPCEPQRCSPEMDPHISNVKQLVCMVDKTRLLSSSQKKSKLMRSDTRTNSASCDSRYYSYLFNFSFIFL